jgi:extracellular elastinolytic metalloproteinase
MRAATGVLLLASVGAALAQRKSLGHGPQLPHAKFVTVVPPVASFAPLKTPADVAKLHLSEILRRPDGYVPIEGVDFFFRDDSYEDDNTGVTHLYIRQLVNGLEVADADIGMNIKDGHLLSYGDSVSFVIIIIYAIVDSGVVRAVFPWRDTILAAKWLWAA